MSDANLPVVLAVTGASGSVYGLRLARMLLEQDVPLYLLVSGTGREVVARETGKAVDEWVADFKALGSVEVPPVDRFFSPIASGSVLTRGMVVAPCSMGALGRIAAGTSNTLIERCADVCLKERRRLILLTRETPLSSIHLENMLQVSRAGAVVMPPVPAFYSNPKTIEYLVDQTLYRVLDLLNLSSSGIQRWNS